MKILCSLRVRLHRGRDVREAPQSVQQEEGQPDGRRGRHFGVPDVRARHPEDGA